MPTIYHISLESIETRYTGQWRENIQKVLETEIQNRNLSNEYTVSTIDGDLVKATTTPGAFLDFAATNIWKSSQLIKIAQLFQQGRVVDGDQFLFTDAWNPAIIQTKYMIDLFNVKAKIHAIWHAGSYDPQDFLGRLIENKEWSYNFERSLFHSIDYNYFATEFHIDLFSDMAFKSYGSYKIEAECEFRKKGKTIRSGQPHEKLVEDLKPFANLEKRDLILFPHRLAPEKQPEIFRDLKASMPEYEFIICQDEKLTKDQYHTLLGQSKIVFSANLQETLGISAMEGIMVNSVPLLPDRLSYSEMYPPQFKYPSDWTNNWDSYLENKNQLINAIHSIIKNYKQFLPVIEEQKAVLIDKYLSANIMITNILENSNG